MYYTIMNSLIGPLVLTGNDEGLTAIYFGMEDFMASKHFGVEREDAHPILHKAVTQMNEYFANKRTDFSVPLSFKGTPFQESVWKELQKIPFGETRSYQDIANAIHNQKAVRAIGQANKSNRIPIIIPCHRVIGKNHSLTGYAGSQVEKKEILLKIEGSL